MGLKVIPTHPVGRGHMATVLLCVLSPVYSFQMGYIHETALHLELHMYLVITMRSPFLLATVGDMNVLQDGIFIPKFARWRVKYDP